MRRSTPLLALVAAVLALGVAACGSSSSNSSGGSGGSGSQGASKPIVIGTICSCSGAVSGSAVEDTPQLVAAWVKWVNANGGINGHPVQDIVKDDANSPTTALVDAKTLVAQDHVVALVSMSNEDSSYQAYVQQAGVPVIDAAPYTAAVSASNDFFPTGTTAIPFTFYAPVVTAKALGKTKMGLFYCAEAPVCATLAGPTGDVAKKLVGGISLVYGGKISSSAPNYTAPCLAAKQAGVDVLEAIVGPTVVTRVYDSCAQQGFKPALVNAGSNVTADVVKDPNANGLSVWAWNLPLIDHSTPGGKLFHQVVNKYASGIVTSPGYDDILVAEFAGLQIFRQAATTEKLTPSSTPAQVKAGLFKIKNATFGGLTPPLTYVNNGKPQAVNCWFLEKVANGKETLPDGPKPKCVPADELGPLYKLFAH